MKAIATAVLLATLAFASSDAPAAEAAPAAANFQAALKAQLESSRETKRGLVFYVGGQSVAGRVIEILPDAVVVSNQEFSRIVLKLDRIDGVAAN